MDSVSVNITHALLPIFPLSTQNIEEWVLLLIKFCMVSLVIDPETIEGNLENRVI